MGRDFVRGQQRADESLVFALAQGTIDIVVAATTPARGAKGDRHVNRVGGHHRRDRVVKIQMARADQLIKRALQRRAGQRTRGQHGYPGRDRGRLRAHHLDQRMRRQSAGERGCKLVAIHGERRARGHARPIRRFDRKRTEPAHLLFEHTDRRIERIAAQRIRADQLAKERGPMRLGHAHRPHLDQAHAHAAARELPCGFAAGEAGTDHVDDRRNHRAKGYRARGGDGKLEPRGSASKSPRRGQAGAARQALAGAGADDPRSAISAAGTGARYPHSLLGHCHRAPSRLVTFSTR